MKYINVFSTEQEFNDVSNNLARPQLSLVNSKIICMPEETVQPKPASNEIWYTTTDGNIFDVSALMDSLIIMANIPDTSHDNIVSNIYDSEKGCYVLTCDKDIVAVGADIDADINVNYLYPLLTGASNFGSNVVTVVLPNSVSIIYQSSFSECTNLTSIIIPNSVTNICDDAFYGCTSLTSAIIGNSVTSIGNSAFGGCTSLTAITIPDSVTSIDTDAFYGCTSLTSITIGNSVTSIGNQVFKGCTSLTSIMSLSQTPPTLGSDVFYNVPSTCPIYVPSGSADAYKAANGWSERAAYIQAIPTE